MPKTRYREVYDNKGNVIAREPYEVGDEELEDERLRGEIDRVMAKRKADWGIDDIKDLLEALAGRFRTKRFPPRGGRREECSKG